MQLNGSQIFVEVLCEQGVDTIFGNTGGTELNSTQVGSMRAAQHIHRHGRGLPKDIHFQRKCFYTSFMDSVPMVAFTGNVVTSGLGKDGFQEAYIEGIKHMGDAISVLIQLIVKVEHRTAGITKDGIHALLTKDLYKNL